MATIGHSLVGLSFGACTRSDTLRGTLRYMWPGLMLLMGHLLDVVEWGVRLLAPRYFENHIVTNSPWLTACVVVLAWLCLAGLFRTRRLHAYLMVGLAIFSHIVLDNRRVRFWLSDIYGGSPDASFTLVRETLPAEAWFYGILWVCVLLLQAARDPRPTERGRQLTWGLLALSILGASSRMMALWLPAYVLAVVHVCLMNRRELCLRYLWSLAPLLPLVALLGVELWAIQLQSRADQHQKRRDFASAIALHREAIEVPTHSSDSTSLVRIGLCQVAMGHYEEAELSFKSAVASSDMAGWARVCLARLYVRREVRETRFFRPDAAARLLGEVLDNPAPRPIKECARRELEKLWNRGHSG